MKTKKKSTEPTEKRWKCRHVKKPMDGFCEMRMLDHDGNAFVNICTVDNKFCVVRRAR